MVGSTPAALGRDFCSDIVGYPKAVLVDSVSSVIRHVHQPFIGWGNQRGIPRVHFGCRVHKMGHAGTGLRLLLHCRNVIVFKIATGC